MVISWVFAGSTFLLYSVFLSILFFLLDLFIETFLISFESFHFAFLSLLLCACISWQLAYMYSFQSPLFSISYTIPFCISSLRETHTHPQIFLNLLCIFNLSWDRFWAFHAELTLKLISSPLFPAPSSLPLTSFDLIICLNTLITNSSSLATLHYTRDIDWLFNNYKGLGLKTKWDILHTSLRCWTNMQMGGHYHCILSPSESLS